jgi:hypothetical protein
VFVTTYLAPPLDYNRLNQMAREPKRAARIKADRTKRKTARLASTYHDPVLFRVPTAADLVDMLCERHGVEKTTVYEDRRLSRQLVEEEMVLDGLIPDPAPDPERAEQLRREKEARERFVLVKGRPTPEEVRALLKH